MRPVVIAATASGKRSSSIQSMSRVWSASKLPDRFAARRIGSGYACAVLTRRQLDGAELLVMAAGEEALGRARALIDELPSAPRASVREVNPRMRRSTMRKIRRRIEAAIPPDATIGAFGMESPIGTSRWPRVRIQLYPEANNPATLAWARDAVARYGDDRVVVTHDGAPATTVDP